MVRLYLFLFFLIHLNLNAQVKGCRDKLANNYNPDAELNDGSCTYSTTSMSPSLICSKLSDSISESSGLIYHLGLYWTVNDSDNPPCIYAFDSINGKILHQTYIYNQVNTDWEELTQDSLFIYIGDFGNNRGSRKDLRILKIRKSDINLGSFADTVKADIIRFEMSDQTNFNNTGQNHDYDMEAFCVTGDSLHLFSKNWVDYKTRHYVCPIDSGFYSLIPQETLDVGGQVTGACRGDNGVIILCGYNKGNYGSFIYLMWDYSQNRFLNGNRRRIEVGNLLSPGQNEAVAYSNGVLYMSNEKQISPAQLHRIYTKGWTGSSWSAGINNKNVSDISFSISGNQLLYSHEGPYLNQTLRFYDYTGKQVYTYSVKENKGSIDVSMWNRGIYLVYAGNILLTEIQIR